MEELKQIIEKNQSVLESIERRLTRIERRFTWNTIFGFIKAVVIIAPIVAGIIYLSPLVRNYMDIIKPLFKNLSIKSDNNTNQAAGPVINLDLLSPEMKNAFCDSEVRETLVQKNCQ